MNSGKAACTLVTNNYIGDALVCHQYLIENNPELKHYIFTIGKLSKKNINFLRNYKSINLISTEDLIDKKILDKLITSYSPFELSNALRGSCHRYIYENTNLEQWIMLDADIAVVGPLEEIFKYYENSEILITSHGSIPHSKRDEIISNELGFLKHGIYNSGLIGFKRGKIAYSAILWLEKRLLHFSEFSRDRINKCIKNEYDFLFVDQLWLNLLPIYFRSCCISFENRFNLGHWNLWEGNLSCTEDNNYFYNEKRVIAFHFSGINSINPEYVSVHNSIYNKNPDLIWGKAAEEYLRNISEMKNKISKEDYFYKDIIPKFSKRLLIIKYINKFLKKISKNKISN